MDQMQTQCALGRGSPAAGIRYDCCLDAAMSVIEGRWKGTILCMLAMEGPLRFSELLRRIGEVSSRILSKQLKELESDGMITRTVGTDRKLKVTYGLTEKGASIMPVLKELAEWGAYHQMVQVILPEVPSPVGDLHHDAPGPGPIEVAEEDALPGAEDQLSARDYQRDGRTDAAGLDVRGGVPLRMAVVRPVREGGRHPADEVRPHVRVGVLVDREAGGGVLGEDEAEAVVHPAHMHDLTDPGGYLDHVGPIGVHGDLCVSRHMTSDMRCYAGI